jgi:adenylate cyclase
MTLFGDWQRGPALINQAIEQNPYYNISVHYALWVDWVRQENTTGLRGNPALQKTLVVLGSVDEGRKLGFVGENEEGVQAGKDLLNANPTFQHVAAC